MLIWGLSYSPQIRAIATIETRRVSLDAINGFPLLIVRGGYFSMFWELFG
jgi:hypothetical protein